MLTKTYLCPSDRKYCCSWEGNSNDIVDHFNAEHDDLIAFSNTVSVNLSINSENYLLLFDSEIYLLQVRAFDDQLHIYLRYLGPPKLAANIKYDLQIECGDQRLDNHNIQLQENFFAISLECIRTFFGDTGFVSCVVLVRRTEPGTDGCFDSDDDDKSVVSMIVDSVGEEDRNGVISRQTHAGSIRSRWGSMSIHNSRLKSVDGDGGTTTAQPKDRNHTNLQRSSSCVTSSSQKIAKRAGSTLRAINEADLDLELRCSNCGEHVSKPIFVCATRHSICQNCYRSDKLCGICEKEITSERNSELEKRSENHYYTCRYKSHGCPETHVHENIEAHEISCLFCLYSCPMDQCTYKAPYKPMVSHLNLIHSSVKMLESFIAVFAKYTELFLVSHKMGIFYCTVKTDNERVRWTAKFFGPPKRHFFCELKFKSKNFKYPLLLIKQDDYYYKELSIAEMKELKMKTKNSILTITG